MRRDSQRLSEYIQFLGLVTACRKIGIYINAVTIHINQAQHEANKQSIKQWQFPRKRQRLNPKQKVKLVYSKGKCIRSKNPTYVQHREYDVDNDTERWVYFDTRYTNPNLRFDEVTDSWFHYSTPGLFKNVTSLRFEVSIKSCVPAQPHPHVIIIWKKQNRTTKIIRG